LKIVDEKIRHGAEKWIFEILWCVTYLYAEKTSPPVNDKDESEVSMANRSLPLINLLTAAAKTNSNVMWK
jgi:Domain of unknown function (DUF1840)